MQRSGNRDYFELDPQAAAPRSLARDSTVGWLFWPAQSRHGPIAVTWNRREGRGIWIIDRAGGREHRLYAAASPDDTLMPIGWSRDVASIYVLDAKPARYRGRLLPVGETVRDARILQIAVATGAARVVAKLPFAEIGGISMTPDGRRLVCSVYSSESDVWLVALGSLNLEGGAVARRRCARHAVVIASRGAHTTSPVAEWQRCLADDCRPERPKHLDL